MTDGPTTVRADERARFSQLALLALCALALVAAALAFPAVGGIAGPGEDTDGTGDDGTEEGPGDGIGDIDPGNWSLPPDGGNGTVDVDCAVVLLDRPVPGARVPVGVIRDGQPAGGVPVRFNGRAVGRTNEQGVVRGTVPYESDLEVSVDVPADVECVFLDRNGNVRRAGTGPAVAATAVGLGQATEGPRANYSVEGSVGVGVRGEPYPGESVEVRATVDDVPMTDAVVVVDGQQVARTDAAGTATVTVPADGSETMTVGVRRGAFAGSRTIDVWVLTVTITPTAPLAVPGGGATARVTVADEPVAGAAVTVDGAPAGTTDGDGLVGFTLPSDPTATIAVEGDGQRTTRSLWPVYVPTLSAIALYLGLLAVAYYRDRTQGVIGVLAATGVLAGLALAVTGLVRDRPPVAAAGALLAVAGAGVLFWQRAHWRAAARDGSRGLQRLLVRLAEAVARLAYGSALALEAAVLWAGGAVGDLSAWLRSRPRSLPALAGALWAWIRGLPARFATLVRVLLAAPRRLRAWWRRRRAGAGPPAQRRTDAGDGRPGGDSSFSLRPAWRQFAQWVVPGPWRRRTPGEVARAAIEAGFPDQVVGEFTSVFRDVEYGKRPLTAQRRERAEAAFERLRGHRRDTEDED